MRSLLTAVLASSSLCALMLVTPAQAAFPGQNGRIAYAGVAGQQDGIYTLEPDGTAQQFLVPDAREPSWSPDGARLAVNGINGIHVVNADETGRATLTTEDVFRDDSHPDWSPDGSRIAFSRFFFFQIGAGSDIHTIGGDGTGEQFSLRGSDPAWSPDGQRFVFVKDTVTLEQDEVGNDVEIHDFDIGTANLDGTGFTAVTSGPDADFQPDWSPDGSQIVFSRRGSGLHIVNTDGSGLRFLMPGGSAPTWSPDGTRIAFSRGVFPAGEIYTVKVDGSDERHVTSSDDGIAAFDPDWESLQGPRREDYKNVSKFCAAERDFLGEQRFRARYGGGVNAHGKCVSRK